MSSLLGMALFVLCSSFNARTSFNGHDLSWNIRFYPTQQDSSTYIIHEYSARYSPGYADKHEVLEKLIIGGKLKSELKMQMYDTKPYYTETIYYDKNHSEEKGTWSMPGYRSIHVGGGTTVELTHYKDFSIKSCELGSGTGRAPRMIFEWDSLHRFYWKGESVYRPVIDTIESIDRVTGEAVLQVRETDKYERTGLWRKYNRSGILIDSLGF